MQLSTQDNYNSGNPERCGSPESCTSPSLPPIATPPPMSHIGPPLPGSPVSPPSSIAVDETDDITALSQSLSSKGVLDEWALNGLAGVLRVGEPSQLDWMEMREGQGEEGLPDPESVRITPGIPYFSLVFPYFSTPLDNCSLHFIIIPNHQHLFSLSPYLIF